MGVRTCKRCYWAHGQDPVSQSGWTCLRRLPWRHLCLHLQQKVTMVMVLNSRQARSARNFTWPVACAAVGDVRKLELYASVGKGFHLELDVCCTTRELPAGRHTKCFSSYLQRLTLANHTIATLQLVSAVLVGSSCKAVCKQMCSLAVAAFTMLHLVKLPAKSEKGLILSEQSTVACSLTGRPSLGSRRGCQFVVYVVNLSAQSLLVQGYGPRGGHLKLQHAPQWSSTPPKPSPGRQQQHPLYSLPRPMPQQPMHGHRAWARHVARNARCGVKPSLVWPAPVLSPEAAKGPMVMLPLSKGKWLSWQGLSEAKCKTRPHYLWLQ